eukprot:TRINITY_DN5585_c0_g1_i4.p3 TRINITY_DN5585_c0_g1~~TRINITY_DN5585_c0_g1_i4.p3  ORF type:complete len:102 (+),score=24.75 TRINITY_DN5585_c0_g1_i4:205-510(+)
MGNCATSDKTPAKKPNFGSPQNSGDPRVERLKKEKCLRGALCNKHSILKSGSDSDSLSCKSGECDNASMSSGKSSTGNPSSHYRTKRPPPLNLKIATGTRR